MTDISINGRKLSKFNPAVALDNENIYSQKDLDEEREAVIDRVLEIIHELEQDNIGSEAYDVDYNVACRDIRDRIKATQMFEEMIDDGVFAEEGEQE